MKPLIFISILLSAALVGCGPAKVDEKPGTKPVVEGPRVKVPEFNADSAWNFAKIQTSFGPRVPNTAAHNACAAWLEAKMKNYTGEVTVQKAKLRAYNGTMLNAKNIIASFNPDATPRILLCAHWDSRPYADWDPDTANHRKPIDGANDGAASVGVLIEIARIFAATPPPLGVDIIFFDAEDYGEPQDDKNQYNTENWGLGSQYWARNPHKAGYRARFGILLDMVGVENPQFAKEGISVQYASDIVEKVWNAASRIGYGNIFVNKMSNPVNDDHYYINKYTGIPTIDIIHYDPETPSGFYKHWHTMKDNMENVNRDALKATGQTILTVVYEEGSPA